jgi:hypothetical protein
MHQLAIDLDEIGFQDIENLESILVHAVMLQRKLDAGYAQCLGHGFGVLDVSGGLLFRNLHNQLFRINPEGSHLLDDPADQRTVLYGLSRQTHKHTFGIVLFAEFKR